RIAVPVAPELLGGAGGGLAVSELPGEVELVLRGPLRGGGELDGRGGGIDLDRGEVTGARRTVGDLDLERVGGEDSAPVAGGDRDHEAPVPLVDVARRRALP